MLLGAICIPSKQPITRALHTVAITVAVVVVDDVAAEAGNFCIAERLAWPGLKQENYGRCGTYDRPRLPYGGVEGPIRQSLHSLSSRLSK